MTNKIIPKCPSNYLYSRAFGIPPHITIYSSGINMCKIRLLWFLCVLDRPNTYKFLIIPIKAIHNGKEKLGKTRENARPTQLVNPGEETDE